MISFIMEQTVNVAQDIVSGWARNFYLTDGEDITKFSPSMTYVPYKNIETKRMYVGLFGTHRRCCCSSLWESSL